MVEKKSKELKTISYKGVQHFVRHETEDFLLICKNNDLTLAFCINLNEATPDEKKVNPTK